MIPQEMIDLFEAGCKANTNDRFRRGNVIELGAAGKLVVAGDIHGHRRNFERICNFADLENNPDQHLILQEIIHGGIADEAGGCLSFELLAEAVRLKLEFPDRVHIIMGNHDTAFINNSEVIKNGREMNVAMLSALKKCFGAQAEQVAGAMERFLFSQPLALRCANRIWVSHSLPSDRFVEKFDPEIFNRNLKVVDVVKPNSAYLLTWGRNHSQATLDRMAQILDVDLFILGHQMQKSGWAKVGRNMLIIISEHNHGQILPIDLAKSYTLDALIESLVPLASIE